MAKNGWSTNQNPTFRRGEMKIPSCGGNTNLHQTLHFEGLKFWWTGRICQPLQGELARVVSFGPGLEFALPSCCHSFSCKCSPGIPHYDYINVLSPKPSPTASTQNSWQGRTPPYLHWATRSQVLAYLHCATGHFCTKINIIWPIFCEDSNIWAQTPPETDEKHGIWSEYVTLGTRCHPSGPGHLVVLHPESPQVTQSFQHLGGTVCKMSCRTSRNLHHKVERTFQKSLQQALRTDLETRQRSVLSPHPPCTKIPRCITDLGNWPRNLPRKHQKSVTTIGCIGCTNMKNYFTPLHPFSLAPNLHNSCRAKGLKPLTSTAISRRSPKRRCRLSFSTRTLTRKCSPGMLWMGHKAARFSSERDGLSVELSNHRPGVHYSSNGSVAFGEAKGLAAEGMSKSSRFSLGLTWKSHKSKLWFSRFSDVLVVQCWFFLCIQTV